MKKNNTFSLFLLLLMPFLGVSQTRMVKLKSGNFDLSELRQSKTFDAAELSHGAQFRIVQFEEIPSTEEKQRFKKEGIELLDYLPDNAFIAKVSPKSNFDALGADDRVVRMAPSFRLSKNLSNEVYPHWTLFGTNQIELTGSYFEGIEASEIVAELKSFGAEVLMLAHKRKTVEFRVSLDRLQDVYASTIFQYFEEMAAPAEPENEPGRLLHRSNSLWGEYVGSLEYSGEGMTVMMQDDGLIGDHIDYTGRIDQSNCAGCSSDPTDDHGDHVAGTIMGAGNIDPSTRGMAHGANLLVFSSANNNYYDVPTLNANSDLVITSKSYSNGCNSGYTTLTRNLDQQVRLIPELIHVFSAGNSGTTDCGYGAGSFWGNITGGHKMGKNVIAVGNLTNLDILATSSSRGPATDGRIKPDICAVGTGVVSTVPGNTYDSKTGTSMSCPGVAGVITQLYDGYKDINGGANPNSGLIKATVLNTAEDLGNTGPDFRYGWGRINARRAFDLLSNNQYYSGMISQSGTESNTILVPSGVKELRVMTYWMDYEGATNSNPSLVNDIDMTLVDPGSQVHEPWLLDASASAAAVSAPAITGPDHLNNMEQVSIVDPMSGTYTVNLTGFAIPQGPQEYFVVYYFIYDEVVLTYPNGGEGLAPTQSTRIHWDASDDTGTFDVEYSLDNGGTWSAVGTAPATSRQMVWTPPSGSVSGLAKVRITRNGISDESDAVFSVIGTPNNLDVAWACPDSMNLSWSAVSGATGYEVSELGSQYMDSIGTTTQTNLTIAFPSTSTSWFSVRALGPDNARGERAIAIQKTPGVVACSSFPPTAQFDTDCDNAGEGYCMSFINTSVNTFSGSAFQWYFPGGTPSTSTLENPTVCYSAPGFQDVSLVVTNTGGGDSIYVSNAIYLSPAQTLPYFDGFENYTTFSNNDAWSTTSTGGTAFLISTNAALSGTKSARLGNYGQPSNEEDELISGPVDLSSLSTGDQMTLSFRYAYRKRSSSSFERLQVLATRDCSDGWVVRRTIQGDVLSSLVETSSWTPSVEEDWVTVHMTNITSTYFTSDFRFKFSFLSGGGNNVYIDDINLYAGAPSDDPVTTSISDVDFEISGLNAFPNPTDEELTVQFGLNTSQAIRLVVTDISGKEIQSTQINGAQGNNMVLMDMNSISSGVYFLRIVGASSQNQIRFVKN